MPSMTIREITSSVSGNSTGYPFSLECWAWFLKELLGYTNFTGYAPGSTKNGTAGEFNITGTDKDFRDTVASSFDLNDEGRYLLVKDSVTQNCGIFKIITYVSSSVVTVDFRSGSTEFPVPSTGIDWWVLSASSIAADGDITVTVDGSTIKYGSYVLLDDGYGINRQMAFRFYEQYHWVGGYTPPDARNWVANTYTGNNWVGGVTTTKMFNPNNTLSGKSLYLSIPQAGYQPVTFTGANPISITDIITQINDFSTYWGGGTVCYESDPAGYETVGGGYITLRVGDGKPAKQASVWDKGLGNEGGSAANNITAHYTGTDPEAWTQLGFEGVIDLAAPNLFIRHNGYDNRTDMGSVPPDTTIAEDLKSNINTAAKYITATRAGATVDLTNTKPGVQGNKAILMGNDDGGPSIGSFNGMENGYMPGPYTFFRCRTPHALGWEIELTLFDPNSSPIIGVRVAADGNWGAGAKILGPVYFGSVAAAANWIYASGDTDGTGLALFSHQSTNNRHNGVLISNLTVFDPGHADAEKVVLMGNTSFSSAQYDGGTFARIYDLYHVGHGYVWDEYLMDQKHVYTVEPSYAGYASSLCKWNARESNSRRGSSSNPGRSGTGDSLAYSAGTVTLTDAGASFTTDDIGKRVGIQGCANAGNNGSFVITARPSSTQVQFSNALGVNETSSFTWNISSGGVGDSISMSGSTVTLTDSAATFVAGDVGKKIRVSKCSHNGNNGLFVITARLSATQVQYDNPDPLAGDETSSFAWSLDDFSDMINGTILVADPENAIGKYEMYRMSGHYSVRGNVWFGWHQRKAFCEDAYLDKFHINDGIAIDWPHVTPQH